MNEKIFSCSSEYEVANFVGLRGVSTIIFMGKIEVLRRSDLIFLEGESAEIL